MSSSYTSMLADPSVLRVTVLVSRSLAGVMSVTSCLAQVTSQWFGVRDTLTGGYNQSIYLGEGLLPRRWLMGRPLKTFGTLMGARVYLTGPMDFVRSRREEKKYGWRTRLTQLLEDLRVIVFDPWNKPLVRWFYEYGR